MSLSTHPWKTNLSKEIMVPDQFQKLITSKLGQDPHLEEFYVNLSIIVSVILLTNKLNL